MNQGSLGQSVEGLVQIGRSHTGQVGNSSFRVALVCPPFAPFGLASLGLSILAGGMRDLGIECKVFYWNVDLVRRIPHPNRKLIYQNFSSPQFFPANEWVFRKVLYPGEDDVSRREVESLLRNSAPDSRQLDHHLQILNHLQQSSELMVSELVAQLQPYDLVGINTSFFQNVPALALAKALKSKWPEKIVVLGGANCHGEMGVTLANRFEFLDYVFLGEADFDFPELVRCLADGYSSSHVSEVAARTDGTVRVHQRRPPIEELDRTPFPVFDDYISQMIESGLAVRPNILLPLETSRGCWWGEKHHCTFCGLNAEGMKHRSKSAERFREEVEQVADTYKVGYFFMADNILQSNLNNGLLAWNVTRNPRLNFFFEIRPSASRKQVSELIHHGITMVQPGIEHFSSRTLLLMEKNLRGIGNIAFLKYAREYGLRPIYNLLCAFPGEDPEEYRRLAQQLPKVTHLRPPTGVSPIQFHRFSPYHDTPDRFSLTLRPFRGYKLLYPLEERELSRMAYLFESHDAPTVPGPPPYLADTAGVVKQWRENYIEGSCTLTWTGKLSIESTIFLKSRDFNMTSITSNRSLARTTAG